MWPVVWQTLFMFFGGRTRKRSHGDKTSGSGAVGRKEGQGAGILTASVKTRPETETSMLRSKPAMRAITIKRRYNVVNTGY